MSDSQGTAGALRSARAGGRMRGAIRLAARALPAVLLAVLLTAAATGPAFAVEPAPAPDGSAPPAGTVGTVGTVPAGPAPDGVPQLSIALDDGREAAAAGDEVGYTLTITNLGAAPVVGLSISQRVPAGVTFGSADNGGDLQGDTVVWTVDLPASGEFTARSVLTVGETAPGELRLAGVVCAALAADQPPLVCASDTDQLPAGAQAVAAAAAGQTGAAAGPTGAPASGTDDGPRWWWFTGGAVLLVLVGAVLGLVLRRAHRRTVAARRAEPVDVGLPVG